LLFVRAKRLGMLPVEHNESVQLALQGTAAYAYVGKRPPAPVGGLAAWG
jgi:hypothetical protein